MVSAAIARKMRLTTARGVFSNIVSVCRDGLSGGSVSHPAGQSRRRNRQWKLACLSRLAPVIHGRERELAIVADLVDRARRSQGGALVIHGEAGVGKSTLLAAARQHAPDLRVLATRGVESEAPLAFAALHRLLRPVWRYVDGLPRPQARALRAVFGEGDTAAVDRFLIFLATLSVLAETAANERPVLIIADDAQWLDEASAAALLFAARRIEADPIAVLFGVRDGDGPGFAVADLPGVPIGSLENDAARHVLNDRAGQLVDEEVVGQLVRATGGNALALTELAGALTADQLAGQVPLPDSLPVTEGIEKAFLARYDRLPPEARTAVLVAAADDSGRVQTVRRAVSALGLAPEALDAAEGSGLVSVADGTVDLRHPLVRSAVYRSAGTSRRRQIHVALATALDADGDFERRVWHRAAAVEQPDDQLLQDLDTVAEAAARRGGHEAASAAWERAAELTVAAGPRAQRLFQAAQSSWLSGNPVRGRVLARSAERDATDLLLRVHVHRLLGQIEWNTTSLNGGYAHIVRAAQLAAGVDDALARQLAMLADSLAAWGATGATGPDPVSLLPPLPPDAPPTVRATMHLLDGFRAVARGLWVNAAEAFRSAFSLLERSDVSSDHILHPNLGIATLHIDDDVRGLELHTEELIAARQSGALTMAEHALTRAFGFQLATGAWAEASAAATEALDLAASIGHSGLAALPNAQLAVMATLRGDGAAERYLANATAIRDTHPLGIIDLLVTDFMHWARGIREGANATAAVNHLERITSPPVQRLAALDRVEAAVRAGRADLAGQWHAELTEFAEGTGVPFARAASEHAAALLADPDSAESHFQLAMHAHRNSLRLPDRARTQLAYGEFLRRAGRRVDAREHLRAALATFEELRAPAYAERAAQELRASGETARRNKTNSEGSLTPTELQVARLVAQGLPNRDVAAQLFVSPRTVDFHLRNVYAKKGISSRGELARVPLG